MHRAARARDGRRRDIGRHDLEIQLPPTVRTGIGYDDLAQEHERLINAPPLGPQGVSKPLCRPDQTKHADQPTHLSRAEQN